VLELPRCTQSPRGNPDMYGIGIRIAIYLQVVMTIFGECSSDPKYAATVGSMNLWFLWALLLAQIFDTDTNQYRDLIALRALGNTIGLVNLGALLLPPARAVDLESNFTRFMRWFLFFACATQPTRESVNGTPCDHEWSFTVIHCGLDCRHHPRGPGGIFEFGVHYLAIPMSVISLILEGPLLPRAKIRGDILLGRGLMPEPDFWFIYPVGDFTPLAHAVGNS